MYEAICRMKKTGVLDPVICQSQAQKILWEKRLKHFSLRDDEGLMWQGLKVPTISQMWAVLNPIHLEKEKHMKGVNILRKALSDKGFVLPPFIGGLERAVNG